MRRWLMIAALSVSGCSNDGGPREAGGASIGSFGPSADSGATTAPDGTVGPATTQGEGPGDDDPGNDETADADDDGPGPVFDVGGDTGGPMVNEDECQKIDFLFVIDNSGSMANEQQALVNSFPGFMNTIAGTVNAQDYQIMVVDTDELNANICTDLCAVFPNCLGIPCNTIPPPTACDMTLGAGIVKNNAGVECGFVGSDRFLTDQEPDLGAAFECAALVGVMGQDNERPMESMVDAVTTEAQPGGCNAGFIRDDAILVVTFITDEEDDDNSAGDPTTWKQALLDAKGGNEQSIVVLGLLGDGDVPGGTCGPLTEPTPILRSFAESFQFGAWGSVCSLDYSPFFTAAVSTIDGACEIFDPEG